VSDPGADDHVEETGWTLRLEATARFPPDYDGDEDGLAWREAFRAEVLPRITAAVLRELGALPGWTARPASRGLPGHDELLVRVERILAG
jgi:hypothetical protein